MSVLTATLTPGELLVLIHCAFRLGVSMSDWTLSLSKECGYPIFREFESCPGLTLVTAPTWQVEFYSA